MVLLSYDHPIPASETLQNGIELCCTEGPFALLPCLGKAANAVSRLKRGRFDVIRTGRVRSPYGAIVDPPLPGRTPVMVSNQMISHRRRLKGVVQHGLGRTHLSRHKR